MAVLKFTLTGRMGEKTNNFTTIIFGKKIINTFYFRLAKGEGKKKALNFVNKKLQEDRSLSLLSLFISAPNRSVFAN